MWRYGKGKRHQIWCLGRAYSRSIEKLMPCGLQLICRPSSCKMWVRGGVVECFQSTQLCLVFIISCNICMMVAIAIHAIHQTRSAQAVHPDNLSAISTLPLPILSFTICQLPVNKFLYEGTMVSVCSTDHHFRHCLGVVPVLRCLLLINALAISHLDCRLSILGLFKK